MLSVARSLQWGNRAEGAPPPAEVDDASGLVPVRAAVLARRPAEAAAARVAGLLRLLEDGERSGLVAAGTHVALRRAVLEAVRERAAGLVTVPDPVPGPGPAPVPVPFTGQ